VIYSIGSVEEVQSKCGSSFGIDVDQVFPLGHGVCAFFGMGHTVDGDVVDKLCYAGEDVGFYEWDFRGGFGGKEEQNLVDYCRLYAGYEVGLV
jgi:hypothetical protein